MKVNADTCSKTCFEDKKCLSFVVSGSGPTCKLYSEDSRDRRLIEQTGSDFYQLVRVGLSRAEYDSCPIDVIYNGVIEENDDLGVYSCYSSIQCLNMCTSSADCISSDYTIGPKLCYLSTASTLTAKLIFSRNNMNFYINRTRWTDFKKSHKMEDVNSVGCGIREFESYFVSQGKYNKGSQMIASYSVLRIPLPSTILEAVFSTESRIQCASSCSLSETCVAFSHSKRTCTLKRYI
ncbi:hypothetical protein Ahia01_000849900 [Argonauta hians]